MKILVISNFFPPHVIGGAEIIAYQQAKALAARGHEIRVLAGDKREQVPGYPVSHDEYDGLPITRVGLQDTDFIGTGNNTAHPEVDQAFLELIADWQPDVVHAHHIIGLSMGLLQLARARGIRIAMTLHDHWGFCISSTRITTAGRLCQDSTACHACHDHIHVQGVDLPLRLRQDYMRWQLDAVDHFISPSHYLAGQYVANGIAAERMNVIANGIELQRFSHVTPPAPGTPLRVLFTGYMGGHKGVPTLLEAAALLPAGSVHLDLVGDGYGLASYIAMIASKAPGVSVKFWGRLPNAEIAERFAESHLFVLPSVCPENQPVTITEAMACGLPVVASRIGGISELVDEGQTGWLFEPGNAQALAEHLAFYIEHPHAIAEHGQASRARIQAYAFDLQIERIEALLAGPGSERPEPLRVIACHGEPTAESFAAFLHEVAPVPANRPQPTSQPCCVPVSWVSPQQADLLWVAGPGLDDPVTAMTHIQAYAALDKPVVIDERCVTPARRTDTALRVRGPEQTALGLGLVLKTI